MRQNFDLHTHTVFSDGKNTPEEMILAAERAGLSAIGISDHSFTAFDVSYCMKRERIAEYKETLAALREKYRGRVEVRCGIEQDYYSGESTEGYDYVIGSVHYIHAGSRYIAVDGHPDELIRAAEELFGGDYYALCEAYFENVSHVAEQTGADIIGHFDLIKKLNVKYPMFDENHPRYVAAARAALDRLIPAGKPFEINTGAISRGYRTDAYPSPQWIDYVRARGGRFILSSDSHKTENIAFGFDRYERMTDAEILPEF